MPSNTKAVAVALATVLLLAPIVGAASVQSNGFVAPGGDSTTALPPTAAQAENGSVTNYTRLYVEDGYRRLELKPGESETFNVTVENGEDRSIEIAPALFVPKVGDRPVEAGWITVDPGQATLEPDAERTVTVTVNVPENAELGEYRGAVRFTDETIRYPGRPPRPVHAASFSVRVHRDPTVFVLPLNRGYAQIEAGETYTRTVRINNTGDRAVPLDPTMNLRDDGARRPGSRSLDRSWFTVDAPSQVPAGGSATVDVTVEVPENATRGDYDAELNLGLRDPARPDRSDYWQRMHVRFQVWEQPEEPFEKPFDVSERTESVVVKLSTNERRSADDTPASFDVAFVGPDGETVEPERVETANHGYVDLSGDRRRYRYASADGIAASGSAYADEGGERVLTYRLDAPDRGEWTLQVMPRDTVSFRYEITRNESTGGDATSTPDTGTETPTTTAGNESTG